MKCSWAALRSFSVEAFHLFGNYCGVIGAAYDDSRVDTPASLSPIVGPRYAPRIGESSNAEH
jgi:hypothetical protein